MTPKLHIPLLADWQDVSAEIPEGTPTYVRGDSGAGALQISIQSIYRNGPEPNPTSNDLIRLSEHVAKLQDAEIFTRYSGECAIGRFGCVIGKSADLARIQIWTLSNGLDFVLATFLCTDPPEAQEALQAEEIVKKAEITRSME